MKYKDISAFDAKTHLSRLLRETEAGSSYVICRRGKPVAYLTPADRREKTSDFKDLASRFRKVRRGLRGALKVRSLVEEGRRH